MESRWLLLVVGVLFAVFVVANVQRGNLLQAVVATVFSVFGFGGFWWNTTRENPIETRFSRSR